LLAYWHLIAQKDSCRRRSHDHFKISTTAVIIFSLTILGAEAKPPAGSDASNHVNKGVELAQQRKYDEAIKEFNAAIEANPKERQGLPESRNGLSCVAEIR
jgi:tetratricopeptide (TPR) repeat protein